MNLDAAERVAGALLYEGYVLYPYRPSSLKNRQRWMFGTLYPPAFAVATAEGDRSAVQTECLISGVNADVKVRVRFLELGPTGDSGRETATERTIDAGSFVLGDAALRTTTVEVETPSSSVRIAVAGTRLARDLVKLAVSVENVTPVADPRMPRAAALCRSLVSTHVLLGAEHGRFVSLLDPPNDLADVVKTLKNDGLWPVLVGKRGADDVMLASPIILYDHPRVAPESAGDLFDATEIDELLTLRILTLSDDERFEVLRADPKGKALLERTEALDEATLASLHGAWRERSGGEDRRSDTTKLDRGDRVVVRPRPNGDVLDLALAGEVATVAIVEQDLEGRLFFGVTIDRDPGRDLGASGQPGHRFFFEREELEKIP